MEPITIKNGYARVKLYTCRNRGALTYMLTWYVGRKRMRRSFANQTEAMAEAKRVVKVLADGRVALTEVNVRELDYYKACEKKLGGVPLDRAVDFYLTYHKMGGPAVTVEAVVNEFTKRINKSHVSARHRQTICGHLKHFSEALGSSQIASLLAKDYDAYLEDEGWGARSRHNHRASLLQLGKYAQRKGYLPRDRMTEMELSEGIRFSKAKKPIWTPDEIQTLLDHASYKMRPWIAIGALAGIRSAEVGRLSWENFDWVNKNIRMEAAVTKTNRDRLAVITPSLEAWLLPYRTLTGNIAESLDISATKPHRDLAPICKETGIQWKPNANRHSFCSYYLVYTQDAAKTALAAGHSVQTLLSTYKVISVNGQTISPAMAKRWVEEILPPGNFSEKIIQISTAR